VNVLEDDPRGDDSPIITHGWVFQPLQALREEIEEGLKKNCRTARLRLLLSESGRRDLMGIGLTCARLFNELNYEKRQAFFKGDLSPEKYYEINKKYYCKYKEVLGVVLKDFNLRIRYAGRIRWEGKRGRLEIIYVNGRWFAHLPIEVGVDPPKSNKRGYVRPNYKDKKGRIVNPRSIRQRDPIEDKEALIDMGLNDIFAVVISDGSALLVKGGTIKSEYYWWKREIATY
jgi:transposase